MFPLLYIIPSFYVFFLYVCVFFLFGMVFSVVMHSLIIIVSCDLPAGIHEHFHIRQRADHKYLDVKKKLFQLPRNMSQKTIRENINHILA